MEPATETAKPAGSRMQRLRAFYLSCAILLLNTLVLFVALNLLLGAAYAIKDWRRKPVASYSGPLFREDGAPIDTGKRTDYQLNWFDFKACQELEPEYAGEVLDDFHALAEKGFLYQPWVQFSEPPFVGKRVSIQTDEWGFPMRGTVNPPKQDGKRTLRIIALGGSTTFGYNVSDEHTWPSALSSNLNARGRSQGLDAQIEVLNYGRGHFFSSQELVLLIDLLKSGHRPSLVIFMDGVNEEHGIDTPHFTPEVRKAFEKAQHREATSERERLASSGLLRKLPMVRLARSLGNRLRGEEKPAARPEQQPLSAEEMEEIADRIAGRMKRNHALAAAVCREYKVSCLFFLQPDATVNYSERLYRSPLPENFRQQRKLQKLFRERLGNVEDFINLGGLFEEWGSDRKAIVDDCHYSPAFSRFLAEKVAAHIRLEELPVFPAPFDESAASGAKRH